VSLICRHNRFTAECPICSRGTVLEPGRRSSPRSRPASRGGEGRSRTAAASSAREARGPYGVAGPYQGDDGLYEVRLERVPGGLRLAAWAAGSLQRRAPVLQGSDLRDLLASAAESGALGDDAGPLLTAIEASGSPVPSGEGPFGSSPGRTGELRDELRVEALHGEQLRVARWIARPGRGWELQEAPVMLPAGRYAEALSSAAERGAICR
jgi:hypothetical protein